MRCQVFAENRGEARLQYSVKLIVRDKAHRSAECALVGTAICLLQGTLIIFSALRKRHWSIKIEIVIDKGIIMVRQRVVFDNRCDTRHAEIGLPTAETR